MKRFVFTMMSYASRCTVRLVCSRLLAQDSLELVWLSIGVLIVVETAQKLFVDLIAKLAGQVHEAEVPLSVGHFRALLHSSAPTTSSAEQMSDS